MSSTANNVVLKAVDPSNNTLATQPFTVIWVTLSFRNTGRYSDDSDDDAAPGFSSGVVGGDFLGPFPGVNQLVVKGVVQPSNFTDTIVIKRNITRAATYMDTNNGSTLDPNVVSPTTGTYTCTQVDQTLCYDDSGRTDKGNQDSTPAPNGNIYDLDAPGIPSASANYVRRFRMNAIQYAVYNGIQASDILTWFARSSLCARSDGSLTWCSSLNKGIQNDDQSGSGTTTSINFDLH